MHDSGGGDLDPVTRYAGQVVRFASILCGWWLLGYCFLVVLDIIGRARFGLTLQGTDEIGGYTLAVTSAFGFAQTLLAGRHTRIELIVQRLPRIPAALLNLLAAIVIAGVAVFLLERGWSVLDESIEFMAVSNSPLQIPLWIPQGLWVVGLGLFAGIAVALAIQAVLMLRDPARLNRLYGPPTIEEEIEESLEATQATEARP
ncbi:TRAP transporter small permease [Roseomonas sp. HJA6]|uniref:TRAP transporter small permease protein n=1 Tax=Roseomonas alba TaxID=2846776 RepID=A0ABS7A7R3_9PROT|nr:TRAP transporter small permease [Neoroseomonas alba]MBW6397355.1 TRAP transporter small permease [Neoroseomonas alba]